MKAKIKMAVKSIHEFILNENEYVWNDLEDASKIYLTSCTCHDRKAYVSFQYLHAEWKEDIDKILDEAKRRLQKTRKKRL